MKKIILFTTLVVSLLFSSTCIAKWVKVSEDMYGTNYVDFDGIQKVDGFVYYWFLGDSLKPTKSEDSSIKFYMQGDCKLFRYIYLSGTTYKTSMGSGNGQTINTPKVWKYAHPNSAGEAMLKKVCKYAN